MLAALQAISAIPQDTLTASFFAASVQDQTDTLSTDRAGLRSDVQAVALDLKQQATRAA